MTRSETALKRRKVELHEHSLAPIAQLISVRASSSGARCIMQGNTTSAVYFAKFNNDTARI